MLILATAVYYRLPVGPGALYLLQCIVFVCIDRLNHQIYTHVMLKNGETSYKKAIKAHTYLNRNYIKKERAAENCVLESNACIRRVRA